MKRYFCTIRGGTINSRTAKIKISQLMLYLTTLQKVYEEKCGKESLAKLYILSSVILHLRTELKVLQSLYNNIKMKR